MVITTILLYVVARERWRWGARAAGTLAAAFLVVDLAFFGANIVKVAQGGWLPLALALAIYGVMTTWKTGRRVLAERIRTEARPLAEFLAEVRLHGPIRVPGAAIFMNGSATRTPSALRHTIEHNKVPHERAAFVTVKTRTIPHVPEDQRLEIEDFGGGLYRVRVSYGFMDEPDVPKALRGAERQGFDLLDPEDTTYFLGRETIVAGPHPGMARWREKLFAFMSRNATSATAYFGIPPDRVVEIGAQIEI